MGEDSKKKIDIKGEQPWWRSALFMFARLSGWIAIPVIIGALFGKWLDRKYDTEPWLFLASVGVAFLVSMIGLVKNTMSEFKKIEGGNEKKKNNKKEH
jgi:F0F1-type ATP synthase assembly protein I